MKIRLYDILFYGITGVFTGVYYFWTLNLEKPLNLYVLTGYGAGLGVLLGLVFYFISLVFELGVLFRYHVLIAAVVILPAIQFESFTIFAGAVFLAIVIPPSIWTVLKWIYQKAASQIHESWMWKTLNHRITPFLCISGLILAFSGHIIHLNIQKPKFPRRSQPAIVSEEEFTNAFNVKRDDKTYDFPVWRPIEYVDNEYKDNKDGTITDHATGLMWQQSGSSNFIPYKEALAYVEQQNNKKFAGYNDWRLPTVDELLSLMEPEKQSNELYIDPIFDKNQMWCWSADKRSGGGVWLVDFGSGLVYWYDEVGGSYVRLVRPGQ